MAAEPSSDPACCDGVEAGRDVDLIGQQDRHRRAAGNHGLHRVAVAHAAGVVVDQLAQRHLHRRLEHAGPLDLAAHAEQLRPAVLLGPERREPLGAAGHHQRRVAQRLDVVDRRRAAPQAGHGRERRLEARLRALALERVEQRRLLAGLVGAGAAVQVDLAVPAAAEDVRADVAGGARVVDGLLQHREQVVELAADVDVGHLRRRSRGSR